MSPSDAPKQKRSSDVEAIRRRSRSRSAAAAPDRQKYASAIASKTAMSTQPGSSNSPAAPPHLGAPGRLASSRAVPVTWRMESASMRRSSAFGRSTAATQIAPPANEQDRRHDSDSKECQGRLRHDVRFEARAEKASRIEYRVAPAFDRERDAIPAFALAVKHRRVGNFEEFARGRGVDGNSQRRRSRSPESGCRSRAQRTVSQNAARAFDRRLLPAPRISAQNSSPPLTRCCIQFGNQAGLEQSGHGLQDARRQRGARNDRSRS